MCLRSAAPLGTLHVAAQLPADEGSAFASFCIYIDPRTWHGTLQAAQEAAKERLAGLTAPAVAAQCSAWLESLAAQQFGGLGGRLLGACGSGRDLLAAESGVRAELDAWEFELRQGGRCACLLALPLSSYVQKVCFLAEQGVPGVLRCSSCPSSMCAWGADWARGCREHGAWAVFMSWAACKWVWAVKCRDGKVWEFVGHSLLTGQWTLLPGQVAAYSCCSCVALACQALPPLFTYLRPCPRENCPRKTRSHCWHCHPTPFHYS